MSHYKLGELSGRIGLLQLENKRSFGGSHLIPSEFTIWAPHSMISIYLSFNSGWSQQWYKYITWMHYYHLVVYVAVCMCVCVCACVCVWMCPRMHEDNLLDQIQKLRDKRWTSHDFAQSDICVYVWSNRRSQRANPHIARGKDTTRWFVIPV